MNRVLQKLREVAMRRTACLDDEEFLLRGLWRVDHRCRPNREERLLNFSFVMAQTEHQGCSYADFGSVDIARYADEFIGKDARFIECTDPSMEIALLDTVYAGIKEPVDVVHDLQGRLSAKAVRRAELVGDEVMALLEETSGRRVANVGVIGNYVAELQRRGVEIVATDYDPILIQDGINGVPVLHGDQTPAIVEAADVALVCGETLINGSLDDVLDAARRGGTRLIVYAVTGAHFAHEYCRIFGIDTVIAEPQPQYLFQGTTRLGILHAKTL
ncbi:hypothetical protein ABH935_006377 [Catenulispora sp. GAS73]|uniref:Rossmann-like domain-containing protein n=1 Tax=Catenulispora sp. GAS73 TaxID=3156269 RepID=UPI00351264D0